MRYHPKNYIIGGFSLLILLIIAGQIYFIDQLFIHLSFHSAIEALGALAALVLSFLILHSFDLQGKEIRFIWIPCALIGMGVLDLFHSFTMPGESFVWLHSAAMFIGGLLFAMVWIPDRALQYISITALPRIILALSCLFGLFFIVNPQTVPVMVDDGGFSNTAELLNLGGGCLFITASFWFFLQYRQNRSVENVLFANHCLLFGIAGILFHFSELWDIEWWLWHVIRLLAYLLALFYVFFLYRQADEKILRKEEQVTLLLNSTAEAIYGLDLHGNCTFCNPACLSILGYDSVGDLLGRNMHDLIHHTRPDGTVYEKEECLIYKAFRQGKGTHVEDEVLWRRDGSSFPTEYWSYPILRENEVAGAVVTFIDITERKKAEESLRESEKKFHSLYASMNEGVCLHEIIYSDADQAVDYAIIDVNPAYESILEMNRENAIGSKASVLYTGDEPPYLDIYAKVAETGEPTSFETYFLPLKKHFKISVFSPEQGKFATVFSDITQRKQAEEELKKYRENLERIVEKRTAELQRTHNQLLHSEKLSAIGKLSASIAHEFNNPLFGIRNVLGGIKQRATLDKDDAELVEMAVQECDRMKYLIQDLQDFNRPTSGEIALTDVHRAIDSILLLFKNEFKQQKIQVKKQYAASLPTIHAVSDQIRQVLLNLLKNASDAIPKGRGTITITTEVLYGKKIAIHIRDNGTGIKPEDLDHIFEPFFSTKPEVTGTGLGLAVSYGIIKKHRGDIKVKSEVGKDTTFTIILPLESEN